MSHKWSRGPTTFLLDALRYEVHYRGRRAEPDGTFGEWQEGKITMVVQPTQEDPLAEKALERRIRFAREKNRIEMEVIGIKNLGTEAPTQGSKDGIAKVVSQEEYDAVERKSRLVFPGHPEWEKAKLVN